MSTEEKKDVLKFYTIPYFEDKGVLYIITKKGERKILPTDDRQFFKVAVGNMI